MAVQTGGRRKWLPERMLAVYIDSSLYPAEWRSGEHGRGGMPMIVETDLTDPAELESLLAEGVRRPYSWEVAGERSGRGATAHTREES